MSNFFDSLRHYPGSWEVTNHEAFSEEEKAAVKRAYVVASEYGESVCFLMRNGQKTFCPCSNNSSFKVGETVDLNKVERITLSREGDSDIYRIEKLED